MTIDRPTITDFTLSNHTHSGSASAGIISHTVLSDRTLSGSHPATAISLVTTNFGNVLSSTDIQVQHAMNTIDDAIIKATGSIAYESSLSITHNRNTSTPSVLPQYIDDNGNLKNTSEWVKGWNRIVNSTKFSNSTDKLNYGYYYQQNVIRGDILGDGNIVIGYSSQTTNNHITCVVVNTTTWAIIATITPTTSRIVPARYNIIALPTTNYFMVSWADTATTASLYYAVYDSAGNTIKSPTAVTNGTNGTYHGATAFSDGSFVLAWKTTTATAGAYFAIYNSSGTETTAKTLITTAGTQNCINCCTLTNGYWVVIMEDAGNDGVYFVYNGSTQQVNSTKFAENIYGAEIHFTVLPLRNKGFIVTYHDEATTNQPYTQVFLYVSDSSWVSIKTILHFASIPAQYMYPALSKSSDGIIYVFGASMGANNLDSRVAMEVFDDFTFEPIVDGINNNYAFGPYLMGGNLYADFPFSIWLIPLSNGKLIMAYQNYSDNYGYFIIQQMTQFTTKITNTNKIDIYNYTGVTQTLIGTVF